jgi:ABC-type polysaccharide/polyol phosphate transport system ATPase subunit
MNSDVLISVEGVSKKFCRDLKKSLVYGVKDVLSESLNLSTSRISLREKEFWALQDISFTVQRGEMLGLIGENGSGKSTLLKILNGLIKPDTGKISINGNVQAMIELGTGFSPVLTGRENIYINASILGLSKAEIDKQLPHIVEFADIGDFIDTPVQNYSSGMKARLGFAIITQINPDILLVDEVLAVGDVAFQEKCMRTMDALRKSNKSIIFVTHSLYQVEALCNKALWLEHGHIVQFGNTDEVVRAYLDYQEKKSIDEASKEGVAFQGAVTESTKAYLEYHDAHKKAGETSTPQSVIPPKDRLVDIREVEMFDENGRKTNEIPFLSSIKIRIHYFAYQKIEMPFINLRVCYKENRIFEASMLVDGYTIDYIEGGGYIDCLISSIRLTPKKYDILFFIRSSDGIVDLIPMKIYASFVVTAKKIEDKIPFKGPMALNQLCYGSHVYIPYTWDVSKSDKL